MRITIGKTLTILRKSNNLTQQEIADRLNVSRPTYTSWEKNHGDISFVKLVCLAEIYKIKLLDILKLLEVENEFYFLAGNTAGSPSIFIDNNNIRILRNA